MDIKFVFDFIGLSNTAMIALMHIRLPCILLVSSFFWFNINTFKVVCKVTVNSYHIFHCRRNVVICFYHESRNILIKCYNDPKLGKSIPAIYTSAFTCLVVSAKVGIVILTQTAPLFLSSFICY